MRMRFATLSQNLGLIRSSLQPLANFSSCLPTQDSRRGASTRSSIKTFQTSGPSLKPPTDTHPAEGNSSNLVLITEQPDNGSQGSTSAIRSSKSIGICEAHRTLPSQDEEEPVSGYSSAIQNSVSTSTRNGSRTRHESIGSMTRLKIKMAPSFSSDEPSKNRTRIARIVIKPQHLSRESEPECFDRKIHLASYAVQKRGDGVRVRLRLTQLISSERRNQGQEFVHQKGKHPEEKDIPPINTEVNNSGDRVGIKLVFDPLNTLEDSNRGSGLVHQEGKSLPLMNTGFMHHNEKTQDHTRKSVLHSLDQRTKQTPSKACLTSIGDRVESTGCEEGLLRNYLSIETLRQHSDLFFPENNSTKKPLVRQVQPTIYLPRWPDNENSMYIRRRFEIPKITTVKPVQSPTHLPRGLDNENLMYIRRCPEITLNDGNKKSLNNKKRPLKYERKAGALQPPISPAPKTFMWTPSQPSGSFSRASGGQKKQDVGKTQSAIDESRGPDGESSDYTRHRDLKARRPSISPVRKVFLQTPWRHSDSFYPAGEDENQRYIGQMHSRRERSTFSDLQLDFRAVRHSNEDKSSGSPDKFSLVWKRRYAVIVHGKWILKPWKNFSNLRWQRLITPDMDGEAILQACSKFPAESPDVIWREFMLWALQHNRERALRVLDVTLSERVIHVPIYVVVDCLAYLAAFYITKRKRRDGSKPDQMLRLAYILIQDSEYRGRGPPQSFEGTLRAILRRCKNDQARTLWDMVATHDFELHRYALLEFLARFEKMADRLRSMDVLHKLCQQYPDRISDNKVRRKVAGYLRAHSNGKPSGDENWFEIRAQVWDISARMNVSPSIKMYNVMIANCVEANQPDAALTLYERARDQKIGPTSKTWGHLLDGFKRGWGSNVLDLVIRDADANIMKDNMRYVFYRILMAKSGLDFPELLEFYGRYHDLALLYEFGIAERGQFLLEPVARSRWPSVSETAFMLQQYIKQDPTSPEVVALCNRYHALFQEGNYYALRMAETDYLSNHFIWAFGKRPETLNMCMMVIRAMLSPEPPPPPGYRSEHVKIQRPTLVTWTLLLQNFCRYQQMVAAEKVLTMMRERGVEPSDLTWSVLICGYSLAQDIDGMMSAVKRMEAAGTPVNKYIIQALGYARNRGEVLKRLDDDIKDKVESKWCGSDGDDDEPEEDSNLQTNKWEADGDRDAESQLRTSFGDRG